MKAESKRPVRLPRSVQKYLRRRKAALRRELSPDQAEKAIERLVRELRKSP